MAALVSQRRPDRGTARDHGRSRARSRATRSPTGAHGHRRRRHRSGGKLSLRVDVSGPRRRHAHSAGDTQLSGHMSTAGTTTAVKDTTVPPSLRGLARPGYVGMLGRTRCTALDHRQSRQLRQMGARRPRRARSSTTAISTRSPAADALRLTSRATRTVPTTVTALQIDKAGNSSPCRLSTPTLTLDTVRRPAASRSTARPPTRR